MSISFPISLHLSAVLIPNVSSRAPPWSTECVLHPEDIHPSRRWTAGKTSFRGRACSCSLCFPGARTGLALSSLFEPTGRPSEGGGVAKSSLLVAAREIWFGLASCQGPHIKTGSSLLDDLSSGQSLRPWTLRDRPFSRSPDHGGFVLVLPPPTPMVTGNA